MSVMKACVRVVPALLAGWLCLCLHTASAGPPHCKSFVIRGQTAGRIDETLLLFGEVHRQDGTQVGSYFEKFKPTQVDAQSRLPQKGKGESLFRLPRGTIATANLSQVVGPGPQPNTVRVETTGDIVKGTGDYAGVTGRFESVSLLTPAFRFETEVTFTVSFPKPKETLRAADYATPRCSGGVRPARYIRPSPSCHRPVKRRYRSAVHRCRTPVRLSRCPSGS